MAHDPDLNGIVTNFEFMKVINNAKSNKPPGYDDIRTDVLKTNP